MVTIKLEISGDTQIERTLTRWSDNARDLRPAWDLIHKDFLGIEAEQFATEGMSGSGGWAALKASTIRAKARKGQNLTTLKATTKLFLSLTSEESSDHAYEAEPDSVFMGTHVSYAGFHQTGTRRMPQRRPVELTETQRESWVKIMQGYLASDA